MKKYLYLLKNNVLFRGFELDDLNSILACLSGKVVCYGKNDIIILSGDPVDFVGIVLSGGIEIIKEDMGGNINILAKLGVNEIFAESLACAGTEESPVTVKASEECEVLFIDFKRIIKSCHNACTYHSHLIENMLGLVARKNDFEFV